MNEDPILQLNIRCMIDFQHGKCRKCGDVLPTDPNAEVWVSFGYGDNRVLCKECGKKESEEE